MTSSTYMTDTDQMLSLLHSNGQLLCRWDMETDALTVLGDTDIWGEGDFPALGGEFQKSLQPNSLARFVEALSKAQDGQTGLECRLTAPDGTSINAKFMTVKAGDVTCFTLEKLDQVDLHTDSSDKSLITRPALCAKIEEFTLNEHNEDAQAYILTIALDRMSFLNEAFGASTVDRLMNEAVFRLRSLLPDQTELARVSGDVFSVLLTDMPAYHAESLAITLIHDFVSRPFHTTHGPVRISLSIGGVAIHGQCMAGGDALAKSETALSRAKLLGGGGFRHYHEGLQNTIAKRALFGRGFDFLEAYDDGRLVMAYQPVVNAGDEGVSFYESLIRMIDRNGKMVPAAEFVPVLEELGFARMADRFAIRSAIEELAQYPEIILSVNVSNWSLIDPQWLRCVSALLLGQPDLASRLIVEVTESTAMQNLEKAKAVIQSLQSLGCRVALDDFGAGYTSFKQIKDLNVDIIKIDQHFVRHSQSEENILFIKALQSLADAMTIQTVAEGAESEREVALLQEMGVSYIQGYACGHPATQRLWLPKTHGERKIA